MSGIRDFVQVDVFGSSGGYGNPVAVVLDGEDLSDDDMARFASWTNLSETTFLLPPTDPAASYRVRIFTPEVELPFAGHPTLGTAHAWAQAHGREGELIVQECGAGLIQVRPLVSHAPAGESSAGMALAAPPTTRSGPLEDDVLAAACSDLGISADEVINHQWVANGPQWIALELADAQAVLEVAMPASLSNFGIGLVGFHPPGGECVYEVRAFFGEGTVAEDPVTGSLNASVAQWLRREGRVPAEYLAAQGTAIGRAGRASIKDESSNGEGPLWVGGQTTTVVRGQVDVLG